jgi:hypothetical protein
MSRNSTSVDTPNGTWAVGPLENIARHFAYQRAPALNGRLLQLWTSPTAQSTIPFPEGTQFFAFARGPDGELVETDRDVGGVTELLLPNTSMAEVWIPGVEIETGLDWWYQMLVLVDDPVAKFPIRRNAGLVRAGFGPDSES